MNTILIADDVDFNQKILVDILKTHMIFMRLFESAQALSKRIRYICFVLLDMIRQKYSDYQEQR